MKRVYILPNLLTSANLFLGMLAIIEVSQYIRDGKEQSLLNACWFILAAAVMDALDGKVARITRSESDFGIQYDSLADLVSFGCAPAFLMNIAHLQDFRLASLATVMFVICGALRLARFNVQRTDEEKKAFTGLPIPAAACMLVSTYLLLRVNEFQWLIRGLPVLMIVLSFLMVSKIPYPSIKSLPLEKAKSFQALFMVVLCGMLAYGLREIKEVLVFAVFSVYLAFGVFAEIYKRVTGRRHSIQEALEDSVMDQSSEEDVY